jgi:hypothetical protein
MHGRAMAISVFQLHTHSLLCVFVNQLGDLCTTTNIRIDRIPKLPGWKTPRLRPSREVCSLLVQQRGKVTDAMQCRGRQVEIRA